MVYNTLEVKGIKNTLSLIIVWQGVHRGYRQCTQIWYTFVYNTIEVKGIKNALSLITVWHGVDRGYWTMYPDINTMMIILS